MSKSQKREVSGTYERARDGYGFVKPDDGGRSIFVRDRSSGDVLHNDRVICQVTDVSSMYAHPEGKIIQVLEHGAKSVVGTFHKKKRGSYVEPIDPNLGDQIRIPAKFQSEAQSGQLVVVNLPRPPYKKLPPDGKIVEILGFPDEKGVRVLSLIKDARVPSDFPSTVMLEAKGIPESVSDEETAGRRRIEGNAVTIDGADTKDVDDAVSLEINAQGHFVLGVHIADVNNYVKEGSGLDREALRRGTSVYLADRVLPMLPVRLSNGICSLNEGVDRLALSCVMEIDENGAVLEHEIFESVIRVSKHMTYPAVSAVLAGNEVDGYAQYQPMLADMERLCQVLAEKRRKRGALDFDYPEAKVIVDDNGSAVDIELEERDIGSRIIEEFMVVCNETIAEYFAWMNMPFVYRVHEPPDEERLVRLKDTLKPLGFRLKGKNISAQQLQTVLDTAKERPDKELINVTVLRSLKQARYADENLGHYGLASKFYCHFTSPIRRYPDLQIHRIIKEYLRGMEEARAEYLSDTLPEVCHQCSLTERRAENLEREVDKLKKAEFMEKKLGYTYNGRVSGITQRGMFVELDNTVEGFISLRDFEEYVEVVDNAIVGKRSGKRYTLGDKVQIVVASVSIESRKIEFILSN